MIDCSYGRFTRSYDAVGQVRRLHWPAVGIVTWIRDKLGQTTCRINPDLSRTTYAYDSRGLITSVRNGYGERSTMVYDAAGRQTVQRLPNGTRVSTIYDGADRIRYLWHRKSTGTVIAATTYTYDAAGRKTSVKLNDGTRSTYVYDPTSQLAGERHTPAGMVTSTLTTFVYDAAGNRTLLNENGTRTTSTYDNANRLRYSLAAAGRTTYSYDANGNQTRILEPTGDRTTFAWTYENQQRLVTLPDDSRVTSTWAPVTRDADEFRVEQEAEDATTKYVWDQHNIIQERNDLNAIEAEYTYAPQAYGDLISQRRDSVTSLYHFDALGSMLALTDSSQVVTDSAFYKAFGEPWVFAGTTVNPYAWIGQLGYYQDDVTGQTSIRARIYETDQARFTSEDPIHFDSNLYRYALNMVLDRVDPSGLELRLLDPDIDNPAINKKRLCSGGMVQYFKQQTTCQEIFEPATGFVYIGAIIVVVGGVAGARGAVAAVATKASWGGAVAVYLLNEAGELVIESATGIPVILGPDDIAEWLAKGFLKKVFKKGTKEFGYEVTEKGAKHADGLVKKAKQQAAEKALRREYQGWLPTTTLQEALKGTGNVGALSTNPNLKGINVKSLLSKTLEQIKKELSKKQWDTLKKHLARCGDDLRHGN